MKKLEIIKEDLEFNIEQIKKRAQDTKIIAMVKGNAYGLGLEQFSKLLIQHGITDLAVSCVEEALELKNLKFAARIFCLEATSLKEDLEKMLDKNIVITIGNAQSAQILNELAREKNIKAHVQIKIDTGFSRYGFLYNDKENVLETIKKSTNLFVDGVFTHLSCAYYSKGTQNDRLQLNRFLELKKYLIQNNINIPMYHIANSSAFLKYDDMLLDASRIGSAFLGRILVENKLNLRKIGILKSNIVDIKYLEKNTSIGYGKMHKLKRNSMIAIAPVRIF